ncbi:hypothetical protein HELRODRAFT_79016, partial [Helobdella robusta]|uniref:Tudor domain-containing protein n=1 Tax=Helobdella robusta TaxID=6412 RepID=T1G3I5_HELRO
DEMPYLSAGDEVSAKYKGAFCEAIITKVHQSVKCKLTLKDGQKSCIAYDKDVKGTLKVYLINNYLVYN